MLETVGHPFAVNPDKALRRLALERGWGTLSFVRPVALFSFKKTARIASASGIALVVAGLVLAWILVRRQRRRA